MRFSPTVILKPINSYLDAVGMYRVVTGALLILTLISLLYSLVGWLPYTTFELSASLLVTVITALAANYLFAAMFRVHANHESALITALIIFFLIIPAQSSALYYSFIIALVTFAAIASKYLLVWKKQHIFNPVSSGLLAVVMLYAFFPLPPGYFESAWWIGQPSLFIPLAIVGAAVVSKVRKWTPVVSFLLVAFAVFLFEEWRFTGEAFIGWQSFWLSGPSIFLAAFMLTEPFTMPPTKTTQRWYGVLVGALSQTTFLQPLVKMTPELALFIGNAYTYIFRLHKKLFLVLQSKQEVAKDTWEYTFVKPEGFTFEAGQYLEWMLPHQNADSRGERRYFTIVSSPTEEVVRLALKYVENGSSYKRELANLQPGQQLIASQLAGDFLLPKSSDKKLGFIAGGIGVTPFVSHTSYLRDTEHDHDVVLLYCVNTMSEMAYQDHFAQVSKDMPLQTIAVVAKEEVDHPHVKGFVTAEVLEERVPDFQERYWYLSGPPPMVNAYTNLLQKNGVPSNQIKTDFFPGLA